MVNWDQIETVFLDMDGTLLDLHFDNYFWTEHLPRRYAEMHRLQEAEAKRKLFELYSKVEGTMNWYCLDYWTATLGVDIPEIKLEVADLIAVHQHVRNFLQALRSTGKRVVLATNAHGDSLQLKMKQTRLGDLLDVMICAHDLGYPKENIHFWTELSRVEPFHPQRSLLVDDSLPVLKAAQRYGLVHLLAISQPDTRRPPRRIQEFSAIRSFLEIMPSTPA